MFRRIRFKLTPAMLLLVLCLVCLYPDLAWAQENSFQGYAPMPGMKMQPTNANPFIGAWLARVPNVSRTGSMLVIVEYLPNGTFRSETTIEGGLMNRAKIQMWGNYRIQQIDKKHFLLGAKAVGIAPKQFCVREGDCKPNTLPEAEQETEEMIDADNLHSTSLSQDAKTEVDAHRTYLPLGFGTPLAESILLPVPQAGPPAPDPDRYHIGLDDPDKRCDKLQQQRICIINNGRMVTDQSGCQVCRELDAPDPKPEATPTPNPHPAANSDQKPVPPSR